ncbi:MAG: SH3 domain-containing protein [Gemmatimonadales bacterium]
MGKSTTIKHYVMALGLATMGALPACSHAWPETAARPAVDTAAARRAALLPAPTRDPEMEQRLTRLELRVLEKEAQVAELQGQLEEARREVVRAMARLQSLASRAEAASAMAEVEVALQSLRTTSAVMAAPEIAQARRLLEMSTTEFNRQNYGGALYLANQAKSLVGLGRGRLADAERGVLRPGEILFAVPLQLQALGQSNVREGPGMNFRVLFTLEKGAALTGHSYAGEWVRISDRGGRSGWIFASRVGR